MPDVVDPITRSRMMAGIRGKNTRPELAIRKRLHSLGFRYRLHPKHIPGKPDFALPRYRAAVFVHGCFWHGHDCSLFRLPGTRPDFWQSKIDGNRARDARVAADLKATQWRQLTIWECAFRGRGSITLDKVIDETVRWLASNESATEIRGKL